MNSTVGIVSVRLISRADEQLTVNGVKSFSDCWHCVKFSYPGLMNNLILIWDSFIHSWHRARLSYPDLMNNLLLMWQSFSRDFSHCGHIGLRLLGNENREIVGLANYHFVTGHCWLCFLYRSRVWRLYIILATKVPWLLFTPFRVGDKYFPTYCRWIEPPLTVLKPFQQNSCVQELSGDNSSHPAFLIDHVLSPIGYGWHSDCRHLSNESVVKGATSLA